MASTYTEAFIEQAVVKALSRDMRTIREAAQELDVNYHTLKRWIRRKSVNAIETSAVREKRPQDWTRAEQLEALCESHGMSGEALQAWCRQKGVFAHHLAASRTALCSASKEAVTHARDGRVFRGENERLKRELMRKDKALAEAAALSVLQKKFRALWEDEDK